MVNKESMAADRNESQHRVGALVFLIPSHFPKKKRKRSQDKNRIPDEKVSLALESYPSPTHTLLRDPRPRQVYSKRTAILG
jgi:hypothetical protein